MKILIVEDEKPIANLIELNLSSSGYQCFCVNDGLQAADMIERCTYDLILLDIMLPGVSGYDLLEQIKPTGTPVIFITAKATLSDRVQGLRAGADDYLVKPFEIVELIAKFRLLNGRDTVVVGVGITEAEADEAYEIFTAELEELSHCGYQSVPIDLGEFYSNYYVVEQVYIDQMRLMRAYVIQLETAFAIIDKESHKILQVGSSVAPLERASDAMNLVDDDELNFIKTLRAFAAYYDFELREISVSESDPYQETKEPLIVGCMADQEGQTVDFGLSIDEGAGYCFIGAISANDADLIQSGLQEETP